MNEGMIFVLVIIFGFVGPIVGFGIYTSHRKEMGKLKTKLDESEKLDLQNQINGMKNRLEVLEAIVTDKGYQLKSDFAELEKKHSMPS